MFAPTYTYSPGISDVQNLRAYNSSGPLTILEKETVSGSKNITVTFDRRVAGVGKTNDFTLTFTTNSLFKKVGSIWEMNIPTVADPKQFSNYTVIVDVPIELGEASLTRPNSASIKTSTKNANIQEITFTKNNLGKSGIYLAFGSTQYYKLNLSYHLTNPNFFAIKSEVALPPTTNYQEVSIPNINPVPVDVTVDTDGNWIAVYNLAPYQKIMVNVNEVVKMNSKPTAAHSSQSELSEDLKPQQYWESNSSVIQDLAKKYNTPEKIYSFVAQKLSYNYKKVAQNERFGAIGALNNPTNAVCLEFTDLFVAIARAAGIPSRMIEGYAYSQNPKLTPVALIKDILHTWPEYYDSNAKTWVAVDPTWSNTTGGADYFHTLDFDHIAFVLNARDSTYPIPAGGYKISQNTKDVAVSFAKSSEFIEKTVPELRNGIPEYSLAGFSVRGVIILQNRGTSSLKNAQFTVSSDLLKNPQIYSVASVPPYGSVTVPVTFPGGRFLTNSSHKVTILFDRHTYIHAIQLDRKSVV